jgi:hypothetical protein
VVNSVVESKASRIGRDANVLTWCERHGECEGERERVKREKNIANV